MNNPKLVEPVWRDNVVIGHCSNITLLDLFAGIALHSLLQMSHSKAFRDKAKKKAKKYGMRVENCLAQDAYMWGKNMLEERENILKGDNDAH